MRNAEFGKLAKGVFDRCMAVMNKKNDEYSMGNDKLHNFKRASAMIQSERFRREPEDALVGMWVKHLVSVFDMVDDLPSLPSIKLLREKMTNAINYLVLLEALFMERMDSGYDECRPEEYAGDSVPVVGSCDDGIRPSTLGELCNRLNYDQVNGGVSDQGIADKILDEIEAWRKKALGL